MKICVLVKAVPDARGSRRIDAATGRLDRSVESGLALGDRYPIETALQLREGLGTPEVEVVAIAMGPDGAQRALRRALAIGADRALQLRDPALVGSDAAATGYALAQLLRREAPDLILTGERSADAGTGVLAAIVAEHLGMPVVTGAQRVTLTGREGLEVRRVTEVCTQVLDVKLPAVISVGADANTPRYVSLKQTMTVDERQLQTLDCAEAGIDPGRIGVAGTAVRCEAWHQPQPRVAGAVHEMPETADAVQLIIEWLAERELI